MAEGKAAGHELAVHSHHTNSAVVAPKNLTGDEFPRLSSDSTKPLEFAEALYRSAEKRALSTIAWYMSRKGVHRGFSKLLRGGAIAFVAIGTLMPLLDGLKLLAFSVSSLGYVSFALAGVCLAVDRFFGLSSAWMRFVSSSLIMQAALRQFQYDWAAARLQLAGKEPAPDQIQALIVRIRDFSAQLDNEVIKETQAWIVEFQSNLAELEKLAKSQAEASRPGSIEVTVVNVEQADDGVTLLVDGAVSQERQKTRKLQVGQMSPGQHSIKIIATARSLPVEASGVVLVPAGGSGAIAVTLPVGTIELEVPNVSHAPRGVRVLLDADLEIVSQLSVTKYVVNQVSTGKHSLHIEGVVGSATKRASVEVQIAPGASSNARLELPA